MTPRRVLQLGPVRELAALGKSTRGSLKAQVIAALEAGGSTDREIAKRVGCDRSYVTVIRRDLGIAIVPAGYGKPPLIDAAEVDALLASGLSQREAGRRLGLSLSAVCMHLHRRKRAGAIPDAGPSASATITPQLVTPGTELTALHSTQVQV